MSELYIKQEILKTLPQVDAVIFDIDGVVLDVSQSYRVVICESTQFFATQFLEMQNTGPLLEPADVEVFKLAGGFNDDVDVTCAAVALVVAKQATTNQQETAALRKQEPHWPAYGEAIKRGGGGPAAAEAFILEMLTPHQRRDFANRYKPALAATIFQEMYGGDEMCPRLFGFDPQHLHGPGYYLREKVMLDASLVPRRLRTGVLTGRLRSETELALGMAKMQNLIPPAAWVTADDGVKKPDGRTLLLARDRIEFNMALYIGDTMDDLRTVFNYRELKGSGRARVLSCIALSGPAGDAHRRAFLEAGAEIVVPDANLMLEYLGQLRN